MSGKLPNKNAAQKNSDSQTREPKTTSTPHQPNQSDMHGMPPPPMQMSPHDSASYLIQAAHSLPQHRPQSGGTWFMSNPTQHNHHFGNELRANTSPSVARGMTPNIFPFTANYMSILSGKESIAVPTEQGHFLSSRVDEGHLRPSGAIHKPIAKAPQMRSLVVDSHRSSVVESEDEKEESDDCLESSNTGHDQDNHAPKGRPNTVPSRSLDREGWSPLLESSSVHKKHRTSGGPMEASIIQRQDTGVQTMTTDVSSPGRKEARKSPKVHTRRDERSAGIIGVTTSSSSLTSSGSNSAGVIEGKETTPTSKARREVQDGEQVHTRAASQHHSRSNNPVRTQLSEEQRATILRMHAEGRSLRVIARSVGCTLSSVQYTVQKFERYHTIQNLPKSGRTRLLGTVNDATFFEIVSQTEGQTLTERLQTISHQLEPIIKHSASTKTIYNEWKRRILQYPPSCKYPRPPSMVLNTEKQEAAAQSPGPEQRQTEPHSQASIMVVASALDQLASQQFPPRSGEPQGTNPYQIQSGQAGQGKQLATSRAAALALVSASASASASTSAPRPPPANPIDPPMLSYAGMQMPYMGYYVPGGGVTIDQKQIASAHAHRFQTHPASALVSASYGGQTAMLPPITAFAALQGDDDDDDGDGDGDGEGEGSEQSRPLSDETEEYTEGTK